MQKLELFIPEPCHANWQDMTPTEQGRFCNACAKEVIDFSMMTDKELVHYFSSLSNGKVCGRVLPEQLDRTISWPKEPTKRLFWYWNYIVMFFMFFAKGNAVKAQGSIKLATELRPDKPLDPKTLSAYITGDTILNSRIVSGTQNGINTVLEKSSIKSIEVITGSGSKLTAFLRVKDELSGLPINQAKISIIKAYSKDPDIVFTDKKGIHNLKRIKQSEAFYIKVEAPGYEINEFEISGREFNSKKKVWEVLLGKQKTEAPELAVIAKFFQERTLTVKCGNGLGVGEGVLYVVDGKIMPAGADINPDDVDEYSILQSPEAMAAFGSAGANGAVVITTRKTKEKSLDTFVVKTDDNYLKGRLGGVGYSVRVTKYQEIKARIITALNDSLKIYPNPVIRGNAFSISLKLKQAGSYSIQVTDASGRMILQKRINAISKEYAEKLPADSRWSAGVYYISVFNNNNQLISKKSFIFQ